MGATDQTDVLLGTTRVVGGNPPVVLFSLGVFGPIGTVTRNGAGDYTHTLAAGFNPNETSIGLSCEHNAADAQANYEVISDTQIRVLLTLAAVLSDAPGYSLTAKRHRTGPVQPPPPPAFVNLLSTLYDGVDEFVDMGDIAPFQFERTDTFSFSVWVKTSNTSRQAIFSKRGSGSADPGYLVQVKSTSGKIQVQIAGASSNDIDVQGQDNAVNDGNWHFVAVTYDGSSTAAGTKIYVDNVLQTKQVNEDNLSLSILNARVFKVSVVGTSTAPFNGNIDEPAVWNKELSVSDVSTIFDAGTPADLALHPSVGNIISWWRCGDSDTFPTWTDNIGSNNGLMTNMEVADFVTDVPP